MEAEPITPLDLAADLPVPKRKRRFSPRKTAMTEKILLHLERSDLDDSLIEMFHNGNLIHFGFDEFLIFSNYDLMKKALEFTRSSKFNDDPVLVNQVFVPLIKRRLGGDFPWFDVLAKDMQTFAIQHIWNWTVEDNDYDYELNSIERSFPHDHAAIRLYVLAAQAMPLEIQMALTKCFWLLELFNASSNNWVYSVSETLLCKRAYMVLDAMAVQPIDNSFVRFLKQLFFYRQVKLGIADVRGAQKNRRARLEKKNFTPETISNNFNAMISLIRFRYGSFGYFKECLNFLSTKMTEDFQITEQPSTTRARIGFWIKAVLSESRFGVRNYYPDIKEILLSHLLLRLGEYYNISVRSGDKLKIRLIAYVPDMVEGAASIPVPHGISKEAVTVQLPLSDNLSAPKLDKPRLESDMLTIKKTPKPDNFAEIVKKAREREKAKRKKQKEKEKRHKKRQKRRDKKHKKRDKSPKRQSWIASPVRTLADYGDADDLY